MDNSHFVGVSADKAAYYWEQAALAARQVIESGRYELVGYNLSTPEERTASYRRFFLEDDNKEFIWFKGYAEPNIIHNYTKMCAPYSFRKGGYGCSESSNLEFVEAFEYINDYDDTLKTTHPNGNLIEYDYLNNIFKDKDPRFAATVGLPGGRFLDGMIEVRRGVSKGGQIPSINDSKEFLHNMDEEYTLSDGKNIKTIGKDGPYEDCKPSKTGFYLLKFIDAELADYDRCTNHWPMFRLAEMYLNLAEAEIESGHIEEALAAVNRVKHRTGIHEITADEVARNGESWLRDRIRNERRVELAYEAHRFWG
ncbi:MAG: RagB/SusD family nutrient uptake outer membrane protein, partial [Bacteroides sp.]|nr:RagB/SusD family nutrient uptake outer membrane protein [Bacteroides sp.]